MYRDVRGLELTAASQQAAEAFDATVGSYLRFGRDTGEFLKALGQSDPDMPMALCLRGYFFNLMGAGALRPRAVKAAEQARAQADRATARERLHITALEAWNRKDLAGAAKAWEAVLFDHPRDILAMKLAHFAHFYQGDLRNHRDSVARCLYAWDASVPGYGNVLGMRAFGLEELGEYQAAESFGRMAAQHAPDDPWAVHAVAHVFEMQDRSAEGIAWITGLEGEWDRANNFRYHLWWHRMLMHLGRGEYELVLKLYDEKLWDPRSDEYLDLCNDAAILLRLELHGIDVGDRWKPLAEKVKGRTNEQILSFIDAHWAIALAAGAPDIVAKLVDAMRGYTGEPGDTVAPVMARVGVPLAEAMVAWRKGEYDRVVDLLLPVRYDIQFVGGSHAQRDLFHMVLIDAALKAGRLPLARILLSERTGDKPNSRWTWQRYAEALERLGEGGQAAAARARAAMLKAAA
jgi:tetratricopeptide (TPR) repeat protein